MAAALTPQIRPNLLSNLIIADIGPARGKMSKEFLHYIQGMKDVELRRVHTRKEADSIMEHYEKVRLAGLPFSIMKSAEREAEHINDFTFS